MSTLLGGTGPGPAGELNPWKKLSIISEKTSQNCMEGLLTKKIKQTKKQPG